MKIIGLLLLLGLALEGMAQVAPPAVPGTVHQFQPLSVKGQKRPVELPPPPGMSPRTQIKILWVILLVAMLVVTIIIVRVVPMLWLKILISVGMFLAGLVLSYILLMVYAYSFGPRIYTKRDIASLAVFNMTDTMGLNTPYFRILEDDDFRLGVALAEDRLILVDYQQNKGIMVPSIHIDTLLHYQGRASDLPVLPAGDADHWVVATGEAQSAAADSILQQVEYHFSGVQPSRVVFRYRQVVKEEDAAEMLQFDLQRMRDFYRESTQGE